MYKKNGKLRVCVDFRDLNKDKPMDGYPMPIADMLVDATAGHKVISFMDGNAGYNLIFMVEEDIAKIAFRCHGVIGLFEWVLMTFGINCVQVGISLFESNTGFGFLQIAPAENDKGYGVRRDKACWTLQKGKD